jgi:hypothetical protein
VFTHAGHDQIDQRALPKLIEYRFRLVAELVRNNDIDQMPGCQRT